MWCYTYRLARLIEANKDPVKALEGIMGILDSFEGPSFKKSEEAQKELRNFKKAPKMAKMIDKMDIDFLERSYTFKAQGQQHTVSLSPWHIANIEAHDEDEDEAGLESEQYGDDSA